MSSFNLNSNTTTKTTENPNIVSIKESITSIENFYKELVIELDKKIKDKDELYRMYNIYKFEELLIVIENVEELIVEKKNKINNIKKIIWETRGRILFNQ